MKERNSQSIVFKYTVNGFIIGLLTVLFIGLKLTNFIDWSWWWVLSPLWIGLVIVLGAFLIIGAIALVVAYFDN